MVNFVKYIFFILLIAIVYGCSDSTVKNNNKVEPPPKEQTQNNQDTKITKHPIAKDDTILIEQNQTILIDALKNDIAENKKELKIQNITDPKYGKAVIKDNKIEYIPNINYIGEDSFEYTIINNKGLISKAVVHIKIIPKANNAPIAIYDSISINQNETIKIDVLANDKSEDKLIIKDITEPLHGKAKVEDNKITYIPNKDFIGEDRFEYIVVDTQGLTSKAVVYIKIKTNPNNAPIAKDDKITLKENETIKIDVLANDSDKDGDTLSIKDLTKPLHGSAKVENNKIIYTPNKDFIGKDSLEYIVTDSKGLISKAIVYIKIEAKSNNTLSIKDDYITINEDTKTQIDVLANDGNISLSIKTLTSAKHASVYIENNKITYNPKQNYNGEDSFSYIVEDKQGNSASATVYVTIKAVNDAPVAIAEISPTTSIKGDEVTLDASLSKDVDGDNLTYEWQDNGTFLSNSKVIKKSDFSVGEHTIKLIVSDGKLSSKVSAKIEIKENNTQPSRLKKSGQTIKYEDFDDGDYQAGVEFNYDRDNSKEIVIDYVTNLEWQDNKNLKNIRRNWSDAKDYCDKLDFGGFTDWRLPTREELYSIIDFSRANSAYSSIFTNSSSDYYWTSTTYLKDNDKAWIVYFYNGMLSLEDKNNPLNIRCVREHK